MFDVRIAPGPGVPDGVLISAAELTERYSHASGPGGQGVNTADSRVQLSFDIAASAAFTPAQRARLISRLGARLDGTVITVDSAVFRSQYRNRREARLRLADILRTALTPPPPPRRPTRPSRAAVERRLLSKHRRSELKRQRSNPGR